MGFHRRGEQAIRVRKAIPEHWKVREHGFVLTKHVPEVCPDCSGIGHVRGSDECRSCGGSGEV